MQKSAGNFLHGLNIKEQGARVRSVKHICRIRGLGKRMDMYLTQLEPKSEVYALILIKKLGKKTSFWKF